MCETLIFPHCAHCHRPMRPVYTTVGEWPGTVRQARVGSAGCQTCVRAGHVPADAITTDGTTCAKCHTTIRPRALTAEQAPGCVARDPEYPEYCVRCGPGAGTVNGRRPNNLKPTPASAKRGVLPDGFEPYSFTPLANDIAKSEDAKFTPAWWGHALCAGKWRQYGNVEPHHAATRPVWTPLQAVRATKKARAETRRLRHLTHTCGECPVRLQCLRDALEFERWEVRARAGWYRVTGMRGGYGPTVRVLYYRTNQNQDQGEGVVE